MVDLAVARIEDVAVLKMQALALHVADKRDAEPRRVPAVVGAFGADLLRRFIGAGGKGLGHHAFKNPVVVDHQHIECGLAIFDLLPQPHGRRLCGLRREGNGKHHGENRHERQRQSKSGYSSPHRHHLTNPSNNGVRLRPFRGLFQSRIRDIEGCFAGDCHKSDVRNRPAAPGQLTPSFFCRLDDDVVYWNTSRLSG